jgi:hypothetical protein
MAFKLPRLPLNWQKQEGLFERFWDNSARELEKVLNQLLSIPLIQDALADLEAATQAAQDAADAAQTAADTANDATDAVTAETSLVNSFIVAGSFTAPLISADSSGNITIASHTREYGNGDTVAITGDTIATAGTNPDVVRVYYDDPTRADTTPTFLHTIDPAAPPVQSGDRHSVGAVVIPSAGTADGNFIKPPGYIEP